MRSSVILTILIVALGCVFGWRQHSRLRGIDEKRQQLTFNVRQLGISPKGITPDGAKSHQTKRHRPRMTQEIDAAKIVANELIAWKLASVGGAAALNVEQVEAILNQLEQFSPRQIKALIMEIRSSSEIDDKSQNHIIQLALLKLGLTSPQASLDLYLEFVDLTKIDVTGEHLISNALRNIASENPEAAVSWLLRNSEKYPQLASDGIKTTIIYSVAKQDPSRAIGLIGELKVKEDEEVLGSYLASSVRSEARIELLAALREYDSKGGNLLKKTLGPLACEIARDDFETGRAWLTSANLNHEEMALFTRHLGHRSAQANSGRWIDLLDDKLTEEELPKVVDPFVSEWTKADPKAVRAWIDENPEAPAKQLANKTYAMVMALHDPQLIKELALTLPAGLDREEFFMNLYLSLMKKDPVVAVECLRQAQRKK